MPPFAKRRPQTRLHRRDAHFLANRNRADRTRSPILNRTQDSAIFAGQLDARRWPIPNAESIEEFRRAEPKSDLDRAYIAQDARTPARSRRQRDGRGSAAGNEDRSHLAVNQSSGSGDAILDCARNGNHFKSRPGFIGGCSRRGFPRIVRIISPRCSDRTWAIRDGQQLPGVGSCTTTVPAFACVSSIAHSVLFGDVLNGFVDRRASRSRQDRRRLGPVVKLAPAIGQDHHLAGPSSNLFVQ